MCTVEYVPPSNQVVEAFARNVCEILAKKWDDESYLDHEVIWGLAQFLKVVAQIEANRLNRQQFDNRTV
ncbi:MAG: hypothetical protein Kow0077_28830 [Anaerolineae bacterium]